MKNSNDIFKEILEMNDTFTQELRELIFKYVDARQQEKEK